MDLKALWDEARPKVQTVVPFDLENHTAVVFRIGYFEWWDYVDVKEFD